MRSSIVIFCPQSTRPFTILFHFSNGHIARVLARPPFVLQRGMQSTRRTFRETVHLVRPFHERFRNWCPRVLLKQSVLHRNVSIPRNGSKGQEEREGAGKSTSTYLYASTATRSGRSAGADGRKQLADGFDRTTRTARCTRWPQFAIANRVKKAKKMHTHTQTQTYRMQFWCAFYRIILRLLVFLFGVCLGVLNMNVIFSIILCGNAK